jgi:adenylosuccinate lyase
MTSEINFSATGSTFAEVEKNWLEKMERHLEACQQLMADIKAGKNV